MDVAWLIPVSVALILSLLVNNIAQGSHFKYYTVFSNTLRITYYLRKQRGIAFSQ